MEIGVKEISDIPSDLIEEQRKPKSKVFEPLSKLYTSVVASFELTPASKPFELEEIDTYA